MSKSTVLITMEAGRHAAYRDEQMRKARGASGSWPMTDSERTAIRTWVAAARGHNRLVVLHKRVAAIGAE